MAGPRCIADPKHLVRQVELDGLTALFHMPSGMTHIVAPPAPQILEAIAGDAGTVEQILARIAAHFEIDGSLEAGAAVEARLAELEAAGLVTRL